MTNKLERLQKVIAQSGVTSRRKAEQLIIDGKVKVNDEIINTLGSKVSESDKIEVNGVPLEKEAPVYYMMYKPRGVISSVKDDKGRKVVTELLGGVTERVFPIGRLDYNTSGILLLTNDGEFANLLMHPKHEIEKVYVAKIKGIPGNAELGQLKKGVKADRDVLKAVKYNILSTDKTKNTMIIELTLHEGKNKHVRRMMEGLGYPVMKLKREKYGMLTLQGLQPGNYRSLTPKEVKQMRNEAIKIVE
ncbi:pseudouridine synthase [Virgibacillus profundi]|uniref:Pseudouridine synthase n=1 Tax=Virgibacillus profundi TaxID=2024555 RepID=A0A2A2IE49_9BACI|nr:pseudouridine synthase [Virgibacillus profundi]PAV29534.1 pseudouridine synthase [Virgibacillus profundi]PXY53704.1 rRNA pseudouridine synthase [Virgibacillus profundi]